MSLPAATSSNAVYDLGNRLTNWNGATVVHDNDGNLTSDGTFTYTYNPRNQLTLVKQGNQTRGSNTYDGLGRRVVRTRRVEPRAGAGLQRQQRHGQLPDRPRP